MIRTFILVFGFGLALAACAGQNPVGDSEAAPPPAASPAEPAAGETGLPSPTTTPFQPAEQASGGQAAGAFDPAWLGTSQRDLVFCTAPDGTSLTMDVEYPAAGQAPFPAVVYVHGGSWVSGDKSEGGHIPGRTGLVRGGNVFVSVNYRLAPAHPFPAQIEDVKCAVRFLRAEADRLGIDPERLAAMGSSAGGHLVSLLGTSDETAGWDAGRPYSDHSSRVRAVVDLFGPAVPEGDLSTGDRELIGKVFGAHSLSDEALKIASPVTYITPDDPPFLLIHGTLDQTVPVRQSQRFAELLEAGGVPVELIVVENAGHGIPGAALEPRPSFPEVMERVRLFLEQAIGRNR